jgi:subtilisin family serine protease
MYKYLVFLLFIGFNASAQLEKMNFQLQKKLSSGLNASKEISLFVRGDESKIKSAVESLGGTFKYAAGNICAVRMPLNRVKELGRIADIKRIESNDLKLQPMNDQMIRNNHAYEVQAGFNMPEGYTGDGVVVGIIDEGIDFTHPDFRDAYNQTRIKYLWDQSIIATNATLSPMPYGYGKEYIGSQIDTATETHDSQFSHGSHVAGIAAGNGRAMNNYTGVAPNSDIIIVKMNLDRPQDEFLSNLVDAIKYIFDHADAMGEPAVINISLGTYFGSHDGKDIQAQAIDNLITSSPGHVVVCSAGNAGTAPIHLGYLADADTNFTWMQPSGNPLYIQGWCDSADFASMHVSIGVDRFHHTYSEVGRLPFSTTGSIQNIVTQDTIYSNHSRVAIVSGLIQNWGDRYSFEYEIEPDSTFRVYGLDTITYLYKLMVTGGGRFDAWSFDMVFDNLPPGSLYPNIVYYKKPDTEQTIVSSFTCSDKVITVGSYINRNRYTNVNYQTTEDLSLVPGNLSTFSSHGPTRDGRVKPDICATGEWVLSCASQSELDILAALEPAKVAAGKKHKRSSGTSMSSPVVAGIVALYLQRNPQATWLDVKTAIIGCADEDNATGMSLPNNQWGYGKVNAYNVVKGCNVGVIESGNYNFVFDAYPNPAIEKISFEYDLTNVKHKIAQIVIRNVLGATVEIIPATGISSAVTSPELQPGMYTSALVIDGKSISLKRFVITR